MSGNGGSFDVAVRIEAVLKPRTLSSAKMAKGSRAALQAIALRKVRAEGTADLARRFFAKAAKVVDTPWAIVVGESAQARDDRATRY